MAYKELIKNFAHIRDYMRQFYIYGFKSRSDYDKKSSRSYDDERRRIESWLGGYMKFHRTDSGKNVFLSIDSRSSRHNPLYKAWKSKSFTDKDITLHFIIFDILYSKNIKLTLSELAQQIDSGYLSVFEQPISFDESTLRKKMKEYITLGLIQSEKQGKKLLYSRSADYELSGYSDVLDFFSEISPCGVIGSFVLDRTEPHKELFTFKHHYITQALDSEILYNIFCAINNKQKIALEYVPRDDRHINTPVVTPVKIYISCQNGRQYLMAAKDNGTIYAYRLDYITAVKPMGAASDFDTYRQKLKDISHYIWGANLRNDGKTETVEFSVYFSDNEKHIYSRLLREKRCGTVTLTDKNHATFYAEVYDSQELVPWIRTFICRITHIRFSNKELEKSFRKDIYDMYSLYSLED